jgi:hypothetical protein
MITQRISPSQQLVLELLRYALDEQESSTPLLDNIPDWEQVFAIAHKQGVSQIVWEGVQRLIDNNNIASDRVPSKPIKLRWALSNERLTKRYNHQVKVIAKLAKALRSEQIELLILKGYGLSLCYPHPEQRACGDIDIWLMGEQKRGDKVLKRSFGIEIDSSKHHHTTFSLDGVMVENHYDFLNVHSQRSNRDIDKILKRLATDNIPCSVAQERIYIPNAQLHSLFLLRHSAAHFAAAEIALRHIVDWAMFVKRYHNDVDWVWLRGIANRYNMERFLDIISSLAITLCGIEPSLVPNLTHHPELEERVLDDILNPRFSDGQPKRGALRIAKFKLQRWWAHRWKQRLVYSDSLISIFISQLWSHILKP